MDISLRHFKKSDSAFIKQHFKSEPAELISEWSRLEYDGLFFEMFAIESEFGLVGYASLYERDKTTVSIGMIIDAEYQRKGVGTKVCDILFDKGKRLGYSKVIAQARQDNTASLGLIKKKGFIRLGESVSRTGNKLYNFERAL